MFTNKKNSLKEITNIFFMYNQKIMMKKISGVDIKVVILKNKPRRT